MHGLGYCWIGADFIWNIESLLPGAQGFGSGEPVALLWGHLTLLKHKACVS